MSHDRRECPDFHYLGTVLQPAHVHQWLPVPDVANHYDCRCGMRMFNAFTHLSDLWYDSLPDQETVDFALKRFGPSDE